MSRVLMALCAVLALVGVAQAGKAPRGRLELEPHLELDVLDDEGVGVGVRATWPVVPRGWLRGVEDSVGFGLGADLILGSEHCNNKVCHDHDRLAIPAVMQWNVWFTPEWSAFVEPGLVLSLRGDDDRDDLNDHDGIDLSLGLALGGRYRVRRDWAVTLRIGHPISSIGASFFF